MIHSAAEPAAEPGADESSSAIGRYDLHTHSSHSDGTTSPEQIVAEAAQLGLAGFSLTDHDTVRGWDEARVAAREHGLEFLPGMELTTRDEHRSTHLLAYGLDPEHPELARALARVLDSRVGRAHEMVTRLSADYDIDWHSIVETGVDRTIGRPHIADALVSRGYFADRGAAFAQVLRPGSPYYVSTYAIDTCDAIRMVDEAGGASVLAHPAAGRHSRSVDQAALERFVRAGLWGIELDHPENRDDWLPPLREFAVRHGLRVTGASDYHGTGKPNRLGERTSSAETWNELRSRVAIPR